MRNHKQLQDVRNNNTSRKKQWLSLAETHMQSKDSGKSYSPTLIDFNSWLRLALGPVP